MAGAGEFLAPGIIARRLARSVSCPERTAAQMFEAGLSDGFPGDRPALPDRCGGCDSGPSPQPGDDEVLGPVMEVFFASLCELGVLRLAL